MLDIYILYILLHVYLWFKVYAKFPSIVRKWQSYTSNYCLALYRDAAKPKEFGRF